MPIFHGGNVWVCVCAGALVHKFKCVFRSVRTFEQCMSCSGCNIFRHVCECVMGTGVRLCMHHAFPQPECTPTHTHTHLDTQHFGKCLAQRAAQPGPGVSLRPHVFTRLHVTERHTCSAKTPPAPPRTRNPPSSIPAVPSRKRLITPAAVPHMCSQRSRKT